MIDEALAWVFPHCCKRCGRTGEVVCECCKKYIVKNTTLQTLGKNMYAVGRRRGLLKKLVDDYKFKSERSAAKVLAEILDANLPIYDGFVVTFIPTVSAHVRERGFDHMALLAKNFARRRNLKCHRFLYRKNNRSQKFLSGTGRQKAASEAFGVRGVKIPEKVLLLDDIYTTGSSVKAARELLARSGVKEVAVAVVCKQ